MRPVGSLGVLFLLLVATAPPAWAAGPIEEILEKARSLCAGYEDGVFDPQDAVVEIDLTGDGQNDTLVDESRFQCSSARSMYCGSGGCTLHTIVGDTVASFQAEGWKMIDWNGRPILLIARDGVWCGGAGAQICFEAVVWSFGEMLTVMPPQQ